MIKNDNANQNQPFVLNSTLGDFLHSVAFFFMCVSLGIGVFGPISYSNNQLVIGFLLQAMFIHTLLAINSRLFFSISAFLTFGSVLLQLFAFFFFMFTTESFNWLPLGHFLVVMFCVLFIVTVIITVQLFCSAALLKLSIYEDPPKPAKKSKKFRKHGAKNRKHSEKSKKKSGDSTTNSENSVIPSTNSCSHAPTCSTRFTSISSMDNSSKIV
ncbi:hypothetical protein GCK72_001773 [Caenorhabditis remanei]|uniref:Uncharacterized protein n=1 Tax=Caenorhabditis remanei TaxID=31234 RepID=A0A6A5HT88_CAERE|nr:hypothetical protein GCK72_001773 [Caenorhabditis remanei]KAF1769956.1 hypothetical protein GCK72_001773 [Caenorhabditis remanei]